MQVKEITISDFSLQELDTYSSSIFPCQLLQSSPWLRFQESVGYMPRLLSAEHKERKIIFAGFEHRLPLGKKYLYIPRGPILHSKELWTSFIKALQEWASEQKYLFVRFEPDASWVPASAGMTVRRVGDVQPSRTLYTELDKNEKDLLEAMHSKTRYNIRLALKKGMAFNYDDKDIDGFIRLIKETSSRDGFSSHSSQYYRKMLESGVARLATIRDQEEILAAGIFAEFADTIIYLHGASASSKRELMAPYALHWEMMMFAKGKNVKQYDWHGIDEKKWPGFTRFKKGFGGHDISYPGTYDLVLETLAYTGYTVMRGIRRLL